MAELTTSEFLRSMVFPNLDAVEANLFNGLDPKQKTTGGSYPLTCPSCKAKEAYYYPFSGFINCPRKNECGKSTSVWDALLSLGYPHAEIFTTLCEAARVEPPRSGRDSNKQPNSQPRIGKAVWQITQQMAAENPAALSAFQKDRGYTDQQMKAMALGFYTTPSDLLKRLSTFGYTSKDAAARGYVEEDAKGNILSGLTGRIIGYWQHTDGDDRLWGRIPTGAGDKATPKYKFAAKLKKEIPYLFNARKRGLPVCVEGTMDAWALQLADIWGCAIGGASINTAQALYLSGRGITELAHMVDGDRAGWEGAVGSIRNCESVGITTSIIPLGSGMDDADALLRAGKSSQLQALVDGRLNSGHYLALMLKAQYAASPLDLHAINRIHATAEVLTEHSKIVFERYASLFGVRPDLHAEAARLFGALLNAGLSLNESLSAVKRRTGYSITFQKDNPSD